MYGHVFSPEQAAAAAQRRVESTAKSRETSTTSSTASSGWQILPKVKTDVARDRQPLPVGLLPEGGVDALQAQIQQMQVKDKKDGDDRSMTSAETTAMEDSLPSGTPRAEWPYVTCQTCNQMPIWRNTLQETVWPKTADDDDNDDWHSDPEPIVHYFCVDCVAAKKEISVPAALGWIRATRTDLKKKMDRTARWKAAQADPPTSFEFIDGSKKKKRLIMRKRVLEIFMPLARAFIIKQQQMKVRLVHGEEHARLCEEMKMEKNFDKIDELLQKIDEAEDKFEALNEPLGYANRARSRVELFRFQMAADYADSWTEVKNGAGTLIGGFSAFYICRAGGKDTECNTLILSKEWSRRHADILAPKQRWKCRCCGAKYATKFGMVVEMRLVSGGTMLTVADCCDHDDKDLHTLILQETYANVQTPEELYDRIPIVLPQENSLIRKAVPSDFWKGQEPTTFGVYKLLNWGVLKGAKQWNWKDMANMFNESDMFEMGLKVDDGEIVEC